MAKAATAFMRATQPCNDWCQCNRMQQIGCAATDTANEPVTVRRRCCGSENPILHERQHSGRKCVQNVGQCVEYCAQSYVRGRSERRAEFKCVIQKGKQWWRTNSCHYLLRDSTSTSTAPSVFGGSENDMEKLDLKCSKAEQ